jgi:hypothetical protein
VLGVARLDGQLLLELRAVLPEILPLDRGTERVEMEGRDALFELLRELCPLAELLADDLDDDCLRPCLDAETGSAKITAARAITSASFCFNPDLFMIAPRRRGRPMCLPGATTIFYQSNGILSK